MSHNPFCPDDWEARREARWDAHSGWNRHRYEDECREAHEVYEREYRREEARMEETRQEERAAEQRAEARRAEERAEEEAAYYYAQSYPEPTYPEPPDAPAEGLSEK